MALSAVAQSVSDVYRSVLRIEAATQVPDYETPWNSGRFSGGIGTGFIIGKNRNGPTGDVLLAFEGVYSRFANCTGAMGYDD